MNDSRAEFEAHARTVPYDVTRHTTGRYKWYETQCAWEVWQYQAARIAELEEQVKQLQREPLSDEQFSEVLHSIPDDDDADSEWMLTDYQLQLIKDGIEAAHNIK